MNSTTLIQKIYSCDSRSRFVYVILAEQAGTLDDELHLFAEGFAAGERALGAGVFTEAAGDFWAISETRPYMRSRLGLAEALVRAGRGGEAIEHYQELLRLNPNDNQGVRYTLMPELLRTGKDVEAAKLLKQYDEESANWAQLEHRRDHMTQTARLKRIRPTRTSGPWRNGSVSAF